MKIIQILQEKVFFTWSFFFFSTCKSAKVKLTDDHSRLSRFMSYFRKHILINILHFKQTKPLNVVKYYYWNHVYLTKTCQKKKTHWILSSLSRWDCMCDMSKWKIFIRPRWDSTGSHVGYIRSIPPEVLFGQDVLKICSKFTGEHPCRSLI